MSNNIQPTSAAGKNGPNGDLFIDCFGEPDPYLYSDVANRALARQSEEERIYSRENQPPPPPLVAKERDLSRKGSPWAQVEDDVFFALNPAKPIDWELLSKIFKREPQECIDRYLQVLAIRGDLPANN